MVAIVAQAARADDWTRDNNAVASELIPIPDLREDDSKLTLSNRNWVVVPIPVFNPTLDTGLVVGGAYFYPQTEEQKKTQPPSVTGAAGFFSSNKSSAFGIGHQSYLHSDKWRIGAILGHSDVKLDLSGPGDGHGSIDWIVKGDFFAGSVSRKIAGNWYVGVIARYVIWISDLA